MYSLNYTFSITILKRIKSSLLLKKKIPNAAYNGEKYGYV